MGGLSFGLLRVHFSSMVSSQEKGHLARTTERVDRRSRWRVGGTCVFSPEQRRDETGSEMESGGKERTGEMQR